jgi:hypothetical protein
VRTRQVDEFLNCFSYSELLGFLPEDPGDDTCIFAIREITTFRWLLAADPMIFLHDDDLFFDSSTEEERGDINASDEQESMSSFAQLASMTDWNLVQLANDYQTATANCTSTKHSLTDEQLNQLRPYLVWIPIESIRNTLASTTQIG